MSDENNSFFQNLFSNRYLKFLVPYVIGAWGVIQVAAFLESRYSWAQGWPDFVLIFGLSLLPAVFFFSYQRTGDFADHLSKSEKAFYPINLILAIGLAFVGQNIANAKDAGIQVSVKNEDGTEVERFVPSNKLVKRIVLLPWENQTKNPEIQWMTFGLPQILNSDMEQDNRLIAIAPESLSDAFDEYDANLNAVPPFSIQRKIALDKYSDYFLSGSITKQDNTYQVSTTLTSTTDGKEIYTKTYENKDPFSIVDQITEDFRKEIYVENELPDNFIDLPVSNLYTPSLEALEAYTGSIKKIQFENSLSEAIKYSEKAVKIDPRFSMAYLLLGQCYYQNNQGQQGKDMISKAMSFKDALSERMQFLIKYYDFSIAKNEPKKAVQLLEMWSQLYPMDYIPYGYLIQWYSRLNELEKAKNTALRALDKGHTGQLLLTLASMENQTGNYENAEAYYERFNKEFPHKSKDVAGLGNTYLARGEFEKAQEHFEKMNLLEPTNTSVIRKLAEIQGKQGNYDKQLSLYQEALSLEKQLNDSLAILQEMEAVYLEKGQINKYFELIEQRWKVSKYAFPSYMQNLYMLYPLNISAMLDQKGRENILEELLVYARAVDKSIGDFECMAKGNYYIFAEDKAALKSTLEECEAELQKYQTDAQNAIINAYAEKVYGNYDEALKQIKMALEQSKINPNNFSLIGEIYMAQKDYKNAIAHFESMLKVDPTSPKVLLELAKIYVETGESSKARTAAEKALVILEDADENYIPAIEAREILNSI